MKMIEIKRQLLEEILDQLKGAQQDYYVESTEMIINEVKVVLRQPDVIKSVGNGKNILRALEELRAEFTDEELKELRDQLPTVL